MTDDQSGFIAPLFQRPTPVAVKAAGKRLMDYAREANVPNDVAIVDMSIPDDRAELQKDQRLLRWFVSIGE